MAQNRYLPNQGRLSIITAMVLLAYSTAAFVHIPANSITIQVPGFLFVANINFFTIISILVAGMAAAGSDWVIAGHPNLGEERRWRHVVLPAMTALVIGVPLNEIAVSPAWWIIFAMGGLLFVVVLVSEYISVDRTDVLFPLSIVSLTVVSMALFLILAITLRGAGLRLYAVLSAIVPAAALVCARTLNLRIAEKWIFHWIIAIALIVGQLTICLFYFPIEPIAFGLILLGLVYGLTSLAANIEEGNMTTRLWVEPTVSFLFFFLLSFLL